MHEYEKHLAAVHNLPSRKIIPERIKKKEVRKVSNKKTEKFQPISKSYKRCKKVKKQMTQKDCNTFIEKRIASFFSDTFQTLKEDNFKLTNKLDCISKEHQEGDALQKFDTFTEEHQENEKDDELSEVNKAKIKEILPCEKCDKVFANTSSLNWHMKVIHRQSSLKCYSCDYKSDNALNMYRHNKEIHELVRKFKCNWCEKCYKRREHYVFHAKNHHPVEFEKSRPEGKVYLSKYSCSQCDYQTKWPTNLCQHKKAKHKLF